MVLGATVANAQFNAFLINESQPLLLNCVDGAPVPDGATVQIFWDSLGNGPTPDDRQPLEGPGFLHVNFNQFLLNGLEILDVPGGFGTDPAFTMSTGIPEPGITGHPLYWLRLCLDAQGIYWESDTFRIVIGVNEVFFGNGPGEVPFTCITGTCGGCLSPSSVTTPVASQAHCDSIVVTWNHDMDNIAGYRILIDGELPYIFIPNPATTRYVDVASSGGVNHLYRIRAYRICDADTAFSTAVEVTGRKNVAPPTPTFVTASEDSCGRVVIDWGIATTLGLDSIRIYRNGAFLVSLPRGNAGNRVYRDLTPLPGRANYCVYGYSITCSLGVARCDSGQAGAAPVCTITNVAASEDRCDSVIVTWTADCQNVTRFRIIRNLTQIDSVANTGGPNFRYAHAPSAGLTGAYQIQAVNACGAGQPMPQPTGDVGRRLTTPTQVAGIVASDTLCSEVCVTWTDLADADEYEVRRDGTALATVAEDVNSYCDDTAVAGVTYTYTVVASNECGVGAVAAGNQGTRRAAGAGTATFALVSAGPPNWTYSMTVTSGCLNTVIIRDFCEGTTATAPTGWTVSVTDDSIIYTSTTAYGANETVGGFGLSHPTCDGDGRWSSGSSGGTIRGPLPVGDNALLPTEYSVNVYPNPFNPLTNFKIAVPSASETRIVVFNINGQVVRDMNMGRLQAGYHTVQFGGSELPSGMYFARILAGNYSSTHKLMLLK